ncbi:TPA: hypothetical protein ACH3X1_008759 [Trebouxia sp. C0004]
MTAAVATAAAVAAGMTDSLDAAGADSLHRDAAAAAGLALAAACPAAADASARIDAAGVGEG